MIKKQARKLLKYYGMSFVYDLKAVIAYPASFWMAAFSIPLWVLVQLVFIETIYGQTETLLGYSKYESYLMYGTYKLIQSLTVVIFYVRLWDLAEKIRGSSDWSLDMMLLKPIDSQIFATTGRFWLPSLSSLLVSIAMIWYSLNKLGPVYELTNWLTYLAVVVIATVFLYVLYLVIQTSMFWLDYTQAGERLWTSFMDFGKYPRQMYPGAWGFLLNIAVPITLMASVPVDYLLGKLPLTNLVTGAGVVAILFGLSRMFWLRSLREYSSFGS
jgi:ABC-2 type transport system permease protein